MLDRMPAPQQSAPVLQKQMPEGHSLSVYGPHHAAPVDEYQTRPGSDEQGPMLEQGVVPGGGSGGQHEWVHTQHGEPVNGGHAHTAPEAMAAAEKSHADLTNGFDMRELTGSRRQAWSGWGPGLVEDAHHKVAGFDWDDHLNGYVSRVANPRVFECSCGVKHPVPSYSNCKCGKIWNSYVIGTAGDRHEASTDTFIAREIPNRQNVIVAGRKNGFDPGYWLKKADTFDPRAYLAAQKRTALEMEDLRFPKSKGYALDDEVEDVTPFPSQHHPKAGDATMNAQPEDWYARGKGNKWVPGVAGPHQFKKKRTDS